MQLIKAQGVALNVMLMLRPMAERIEVAGSVRRRKADVHDVELVIIPKVIESRARGALFSGPNEPIFEALDALCANPRSRFHRGDRWGSKYRKLIYRHEGRGFPVDLFFVRRETFGPQLAIRTGPAEFSRLLVTHCSKGGVMPDDSHLDGGQVIGPDGPISLDSEEAFFQYLGLPCWDAHRRSDVLLQHHLRQLSDLPAGVGG